MPGRRCRLEGTARCGRPRRVSSTNAVRLPRGPTSTKMRNPAPYIASIVSRKRTGRAHCSRASLRTSSGSAGGGAAGGGGEEGGGGRAAGGGARAQGQLV